MNPFLPTSILEEEDICVKKLSFFSLFAYFSWVLRISGYQSKAKFSMNLSNGKGNMSTASSSAGLKARDVVPDQFPAGLRVLVVDDDSTCLAILEKMLRTCRYQVTKCSRAEKALSLLRGNKSGFDIVISDVHMPDMDGFKLLEHIGLEMDLPVIMMSADDSKNVVLKGVTHGACDYLIKPVRIEALKNIWQHVIRKKKNDWKDLEQSGSVEEGDRQPKQSEDADYSSSVNESNWKSCKKRKDEEEETEDRDDPLALKKPRVVWSIELHQQFVAAVNQLGIDKAVPKKILELMKVPGLTRENVASHLQKYRLYLRRLSGVSQHQNNLSNSFLSSQEASLGAMVSLNGLDLKALAATCQIPAQSHATLQAAGLGRSTAKSGIPLPVVDQRNLFSFENPKLRFGEGQQQQLSNRPMKLLHGIPTTVESKQFASLHQTSQSPGSVNMPGAQNNSPLMQMAQQQPQGQILNESTGSHVLRLPSSIEQPTVLNGIASGVLRNGTADGAGYNTVLQNSSIMSLSPDRTAEVPNRSFPLGSPGVSCLTSKGRFPEEFNSGVKRSSGFLPSYDIFNDLNQHRLNQWDLQNLGLSFDVPQHSNLAQGSLDVPSLVLAQGLSSSQRSLHNRNQNQSNAGKAMLTMGEDNHGITQNTSQQLDSFLLESSIRVKTERVSYSNSQTGFFMEQLGPEDLMSAILKQQQANTVPADNEFDFEGFSLDNIPV